MGDFSGLFTDEVKVDNKRKHTIKGLTNELEDITDAQIASIKAELKSKAPAGVSERSFDIDARRIFQKRTTVDRVIKMYQEG